MRNSNVPGRRRLPINILQAMTPQEHAFFGGEITVSSEKEWVTPIGIAQGISSEQIREARSKGWARNPTLESGYQYAGHLTNDENFAVWLAPLDPEGQTIEDPKSFAGIWNEELKTLEPVRELTELSKRSAAETGMEVFYREEPQEPEGTRRGKEG